MFAATALFTLVLGAPAAVDSPAVERPHVAAERGDVIVAQDPKVEDEEEGIFDNLMERRYAFSINDDLHPSLEGELWPFFVGGIFGCVAGQVWLPLLVLDEKPEDAFEEGLITWLFYAIPLGVLWVPNLIPYLNFLYGPAYCVGCLAVNFYLLPVNVINTWDRQAKRLGVEGKKKKKKSSAIERPDEPSELVGLAMAY